MVYVANLFDPKNEWFVYKKYGDLYVVPYAEYIASESLWISIWNSSNVSRLDEVGDFENETLKLLLNLN